MKKHYKLILLVFCTVLSFGLAAPQLAGAGVPATALPMGGFVKGSAYCVNNSGQCAGYLKDNDNYDHACFWDFGTLTPIFLDKAGDGVLDDYADTYGGYINASGQVAGAGYDDTGYERGFFWTKAGGMVDIGTLLVGDGWTEPRGINDSGQIIVDSSDDDVDRDFLWSAGTRTELTCTYEGTVYPINIYWGAIKNSGQVAGVVSAWALNDPPVLWDGTATILDLDIASAPEVYMNNAGQIAGFRRNGENPWIYTPGEGLRFIDVTGHYPDLAAHTIVVSGINDQGQVLIYQDDRVSRRAMVWQDDGSGGDLFTDIPVGCLALPDTNTIYVFSINVNGQVIGAESNAGGERTRYFFWDPTTPDGIALLAPLAGTVKTSASALNDNGLIVGCSQNASYSTVLPCMWQTNGVAMTYPPVLDASAAPATGLAGSNISFTATATDPDAGDTLAFSLDPGAPAGAVIGSSTGDFSWTPAEAQTGQFTFTIRVTDSEGLCDTAQVTIDVAMPSALPLTVQSIARKGQSVIVSVLIENPTAADVTDVSVTSSSLGGVNTASRMPDSLRTIRAGTSKTCRLKFATDAVPAGDASFSVNGTCSIGGFYKTETVTVP
jgi:probable HAF family extracellular repeat protein